MKKNSILKILILVIAFCITTKVKAEYNGGGGVSYSGSGGASGSCVHQCFNSDYFFIQARLYYIDNSKGQFSWTDGNGKEQPIDNQRDQCHGTYFFADGTKDMVNSSYWYLNTKLKIPTACIFSMEGQSATYNGSTITWTKSFASDNDRYAKASTILRHYLGDDVNSCEDKVCTPNNNLKNFLNWVTAGKDDTSETYAEVMTKDSETAIRTARTVSAGAKKGYRIILEPSLIYINPNMLKTPKQAANSEWAAELNKSGNRPLTGNSTAQVQYMYTDFSDVGIDYGSHDWCANKATLNDLANWKIGCGMNIIDVGKYTKTHYCYDSKDITGSLECKYYDKNNTSSNFKEKYKKEICDAEKEKKSKNSEYGKRIAENSNCTLYCIESAEASFPGGISNPVTYNEELTTTGIYFAWPARIGAQTGMKMYMKSQYKCTIVQKDGRTCSKTNIKNLITSGESSIKKLAFSAKLKAGTNKAIDDNLSIASDKTSHSNPQNYTMKNGTYGTITITRKVDFEIKKNTNRYYNRKTGEVKNNTSGWLNTEVFDREYGVISLREEDFPSTGSLEKTLQIYDVHLGTGNQFGERIGKYICKYNLGPKTCKCRAGTVQEGTDLYRQLTQGKTCLELNETECNKCTCPDDSTYSEWGKDITGAEDITGESMTSEACTKLQQKFCYHKTCDEEEVPPSTYKACVDKYMKNEGKSLAEATELCDEDLCPGNKKEKCDAANQDEWDACMKENKDTKSYDERYNICDERLCQKTRCEKVDENTWETCMNGDDNNYKKCWDEYCETDERPRCTRVPKDTWDKCLDDGYGWTKCYRKYCPYGPCKNCEYTCKKKDGTEVNISKCISDEQMNNGATFDEANAACSKQYCDSGDGKECVNNCKWAKKGNKYIKTCNGKKCGEYTLYCPNNRCIKPNEIVYRLIDLNNPFPGKTGTGVTTSFSNDGLSGRVPSTNWNYVEAVKKEILNARGVKGEALYNKKPLYTITLTPNTIKEIQKYNKTHSYNDFRLDCKNVNKTSACISEFLHKELYSYSAVKSEKSVDSCYNIGKSEAGFNNCYNKNN